MTSEDNALSLPKDYADWLAQLKSKMRQSILFLHTRKEQERNKEQ